MLWFVNPSAPKRRRTAPKRRRTTPKKRYMRTRRKIPTVYDCRKPGCPALSEADALIWYAKHEPSVLRGLRGQGRSKTRIVETPPRATGRRVSQAVRDAGAAALRMVSEKARSWVKKRKRNPLPVLTLPRPLPAQLRRNPFTQESFAKAKAAYAARGKTARQRTALAGAFTRRVKKGLKKTAARQAVLGPRRDAKGQFRKAPGGPRVAASAVPLMESLLAGPTRKRKATKAKRKVQVRTRTVYVRVAAKTARKQKGASAMAKRRKRRVSARRPRRDSKGRFLSKRTVRTARTRKRKYRRNPSAAVMAAVVKQTKSRRRRRFKGQGQARYFLKKWQTRPGRKIKRKSIRRLAAGHRRVLWYKAYGSAAARRYIKRHRLNPARRRSGGGGKLGTTIKQVLLTAAPLVGAFYVSRLIATKVAGVGALAAVTSKLGRHTKPLLSAAVLGAAFFGTKKLPKYRMPALLGAALNFVDVAFREYAPAPIQAFLGTGDSQVYDEALLGAGDYVQPQGSLGDYMQTGAYEEIGDYFQGQGQFEEVGGVRPMDVMPATRQIQPWAAEPDEAFYTGVFSGGFGS